MPPTQSLLQLQLTAAPQQHHGQHNTKYARPQSDAQRSEQCLPQHLLLQDANHRLIGAVGDHRQQWGQQQQQRGGNQQKVTDASPQAVFRITPDSGMGIADRQRLAQALAEDHQPQAA
ncbi:hypothetical protein D3C71_1614250 [compost metagenome]